MSAAVLQLIEESWKSIMKKRLLEMALLEDAKNVTLSLADTTKVRFALLVKRKALFPKEINCWG